VPQDGRFRVRYKNRLIDFRVSIMPTIHGENAVLRVLDKESMSEKFHHLTLDVVGFADADLKRFRAYIREPYGMVLVTGPHRLRQNDHAVCRAERDQKRRGQDHHHRGSVEYQIRGITQIPGQREKGLTFARGCARFCATTRIRSWSAKSATRRRRRLPSTPR